MLDLTFKFRVLRLMIASTFEEWRTGVWERDLDSPYCCNGRECGCGASTVREIWSWDVDHG